MATLTRRKLTPADHGREIDPDEFEASTADPGHDCDYELINGRVCVVPAPDMPQQSLDAWLHAKLLFYSLEHPEVINFVPNKARVFLPGRSKTTCPEPDVAAYQNFPRETPIKSRRWQDVSPLIVAKVVSENDPDKDYVRNVALYLEVPSVREYWILDGCPDPDEPKLTVYRRRGARWQKPIVVPFGDTYESPRVLPGFSLLIDPHK